MKPATQDIKEVIKDNVLIQRTDVKTEDLPPTEDDSPDSPLYNFYEDQEERLITEVFRLFDILKEDRKDDEKRWDDLEAQYDGMMEKSKLEFNLNVPVTMVKCDSVERLALKSFIESDPKYSCTLRPEAIRKSMTNDKIEELQQKQEDYLDYQLDERINIESPLRKVLHQAVVLDYGLIKIPYEYIRKRRTRNEFYSGKAIRNEQSGKLEAEGMKEFLRNYPLAALPGEEGHKYFQKLIKFEDARFEADYWYVAYDDPCPKFVDIRDFYVRLSCEGYRGLCDEQIKIERQRYTFWELKKLEKAKKLKNVDMMKYATADDVKNQNQDEKYDLKELDVLEVDYYFRENEDSDEEIHIVAWFGEHNKSFLGAVLYQYHAIESIFVPFFIKDKKKGMLKGGMARDLTDSNIAQNAILNMMLTESWLELITTPVVRSSSDIAEQVLSGRWAPGVPLVTEENVQSIKEEIDFLPKPQNAVAGQLINVLMFLAKMDDDRTGVSAGMSGKENPMDPRAPAAKTAMLLKQSGINIEEYINCLLPSFNKVGEIILQQTYQMSNSGRKFRSRRINSVAGGVGNPYAEISRDEMILETMIQSRASGFAFDKINEKQENLTIYQLMRQDPLIARNPKAVHELARTLLKSWSPTWKAKADKLVLSNQEFNQEILKVGVQSLGMYMQALQQQKETTGAEAQPQLDDYLKMTAQLLMQSVNPTEEEQKK